MQGKVIYEFDPFRLDPRERLLLQRGQPVDLSPQLFELLVVFVENAGHLLSKEELREKIWRKSHVSEDTLKVVVGNLRRVLRKGQNDQPWIESVRGGGYRFVAEVKRSDEALAIDEKAIDGGSPDGIAPFNSETRRQENYKFRAVVALIALAFAGGCGLLLLSEPNLRVDQYVPLTSDVQDKGGPLFTDGARVYFQEQGPNGTSLAAVAAGGGGTGVIGFSWGEGEVFDFSALHSEFLVGRFISAEEGSELWVKPILGGPPRRIGDLHASGAHWSSDGSQIVFTFHRKLYVSNGDGSKAHKIAETPDDMQWLRWSPDGKRIRFTEGKYLNGEISQSIWEVDVDGSNLHRLLDGWNTPARECCGSWTPDGRFFVFEAMREGRTDIWALPERRDLFSGLFKKGFGLPVRLSSGLQGYLSPILSIDGKEIFAVGVDKHGELVRYDSGIKAFVPFLGGISATWVSFSKSGHSVAYIDYPGLTVWRAKGDGSEKTQITFSPLEVDGLSWSPDEKWLALRARIRGNNWLIHIVPAQGGDVKLVMPSQAEQGVPTWSADGTRIAFGDVPSVFGHPTGKEVIHMLDLKTHKLSELPRSEGLWTARWSPSGKYLAALTIKEQQLRIYDFGSKKWQSTKASDVNNFNWSRDGKYIYFDTEGRNRALRRVSTVDGHVEELTSLRAYPNLATWWSGIASDDSPLILRKLGTNEIYALTLENR